MSEQKQIQTRIPAVLWESLQVTFYQHDYEFLKQVSSLIRVGVPELKRNLLGAKGALTTVQIANETKWWEGVHCPLRVRSKYGLWRACTNYCEAHGTCGDHKGWKKTAELRHRNDTYFQKIPVRRPFRLEEEDRILWVSEHDGTAVDERGYPVDIRVNLALGAVLPEILSEHTIK